MLRLNRFTKLICGICLVVMPVSVFAQPPAPPIEDENASNQSQEQTLPLQQPTTPTQNRRNLFNTAFGDTPMSSSRQRLTRAPDMFGDAFFPGSGISFCPSGGDGGEDCEDFTMSPFPQPGGGILKIGENGEVLPVDRVFFTYNHFHNALDAQGPGTNSSANYDRFTVGVEKTWSEGMYSLEVRIPMSAGLESRLDDPISGLTELDGGNFGNISLILKSLLYQDEQFAFGGGLALELPTGNDIDLLLGDIGTFTIENQAFLLHPYIGGMYVAENDVFSSAYLQFDFGLNDNDYKFSEIGGVGDSAAANLIQISYSLGKWLYQSDSNQGITGIAPIMELHYVSTIRDIEAFGDLNEPGLEPINNTFEMLNMTGGVNLEVNGNSMLRFGAVFPLLGADSRAFDAEIMAQYTLYY